MATNAHTHARGRHGACAIPCSVNAALTFANATTWCGGESAMSPALAARRISAVTNDTRTVQRDGLFVALRGEREDGHRFVGAALAAGAVALVARRKRSMFTAAQLPRLIFVHDPLAALQRLGAAYRRELGLLVIGLTGSSGKTTTRTFVSEVLASSLAVSGTRGNWNNHIGVPLSILNLAPDAYVGVLEMGANHVGEIHVLSRIARPDIAIITNIGYGHVGLFGSLARTTRAKFEIVDGLNRTNGLLIINGDDSRLVKGAARLGLRTIRYGLSARCEWRATDVVCTAAGSRFCMGGRVYRLRMPGRHFVYAALPAVGLGLRLGLSPAVIARALASIQPVSMRGAMEKRRGVRFVLDCYNANPSSMQSGLELLADVALAPRRVAVLGDMLELGRYAKPLHRQLGRRLAHSGVRQAVVVGQFAGEVAAGARQAGMRARSILTTATADEALDALKATARPGDTVLLKASRGVKLERVFEGF